MQPVEGQSFLAKEFGLLDRYEAQGVLVRALQRTEFHAHLADKVSGCHKKFRHKRCVNNHSWAKAQNSCSVRLCPHCSNRKTKMIGERVQKFVVGKQNLKYLVLAERNSKNLQQGIRSLYAAWDRLRRSVFWKRNVAGCVAVLEVTYSKTRKDWHPHLNIFLEGEYMPFKLLNFKWQAATEGRGRTSRIQKATENTVWELIKYTLKVAEYENTNEGRVLTLLFEDPEVLDEFLSAVYGVRLIRTYGIFRSMGDVEREEEECPDCSSTCIVDIGGVSHSQLSFDFEKQVFRIVRGPSVRDHALHLVRPTDGWSLSSHPEAKARAVEGRRRMAVYEKSVAARYGKRRAS